MKMESTPTPTLFHTTVVHDCDEKIIYRGNMKNLKEVELWLDEYGKLTHTNWIVFYTLSDARRYILHKIWKCQHSHKNKVDNSKRNTKCPVTLDVKVKDVTKGTKKNDAYLKQKPPLCAIVKVEGKHNHTIGSADSLKYLRVDDETQKKFTSYFDSGLTPAQAIRLHTSMLLVEEDGEFKLADASLCPTSRSVYYMYDKWSATHFGKIDPLAKLEEKIEDYSKIGSYIVVKKERDIWAVLVLTPIMKRNQKQNWSKELVFVDTTASCDITQVNLTVVSTATPAGAVPIAILLHSAQTEECYKLAFQLLKEEAPNCFGGSECPFGFMTDDSSAEKNALKTVWPHARQLLCNFHVAQAEWNWLLQNSTKNDRQYLMAVFKNIQRADSEEKLQEAIKVVDSLEDAKYTKFRKRVHKFLKRKEEWILLYRLDVVTRNNNTNNYSEASIRILKDIVLERTKAFNIVALVEFTVYVWEEYFTSRLLKVAYNRSDKYALLYRKLCSRADQILQSDVKKLSDTEYEVKSCASSDVWYSINVDVGVCSCISGRQGSMCKHQVFIHKHFNISLPNEPPVNFAGRYLMAQLALGERCPHPNFFKDLRDTATAGLIQDVSIDVATQEENFVNLSVDSQSHVCISDSTNNAERKKLTTMNSTSCTDDDIASCAGTFQSFLVQVKSQPNSKILVNKLENALKTVTSPSTAMSALVYLRSAVVTNRRRAGKIHVQPRTPSRRRKGVCRGSRPIPMGRPTKTEVLKRGLKKRSRNLSQNISQNFANAKSH